MRFRLSDDQVRQLEPFVKDQSILDLGAAELAGSELLVELGARDVLAVDRNRMPTPSSELITTQVTQFHMLEETRPVVLASWIVNWPVNIERHLRAAKYIISISKNTDGSSCGYEQMWQLLMMREVLLYVPERKNALTVYGPDSGIRRTPTGEELAATWPDPMRMFSFEEAEELVKQKRPADEGEASGS
jgi:hypothetical protein